MRRRAPAIMTSDTRPRIGPERHGLVIMDWGVSDDGRWRELTG